MGFSKLFGNELSELKTQSLDLRVRDKKGPLQHVYLKFGRY